MWRYLTYSLLHLDLQHFLTNICLQLVVGLVMEMRHRALRVALLFTLGVLSSSLAFYCFDNYVLLGASGGIYCLVVSCICTTILNWKEDETFLINRCRRAKSPIACNGKFLRIIKIIGILGFGSLDLGFSLRHRFTKTDNGASMVAHSFGSLAGFLAGFVVLRDMTEEVLLLILWLLLLLLLLLRCGSRSGSFAAWVSVPWVCWP